MKVAFARFVVYGVSMSFGLLWMAGCSGGSSGSPPPTTPVIAGQAPGGGSGATGGAPGGGSGSTGGGGTGATTGGGSGSTSGGSTGNPNGGPAPSEFIQQSYSNVGGDQVLSADLNGDNKADLVLYSGRLSVMLNHGSGHFAAPSALPFPKDFDSATYVALGDFDNDGFSDIAACEFASFVSPSRTVVAIYLNDRSGHFSLSQTIDVPACNGIAAGDANRDGRGDVVIGYANGSSTEPNNIIVTYLGDGLGHFNTSVTQSNMALVAQQSFLNPCYLFRTAGADFDGDGVLDLILFGSCQPGSQTEGNLYFGKGDGTGHYLLTEINEGPGQIFGALQAKDINRDGKLDFSFVNVADAPHGTSNTALRLAINQGAGSFVLSTAVRNNSETSLNAGSFTDVNGDGISDAVVGFSASDCCSQPAIPQGISVMTGQPDGTFAETQRWATPARPDSIATADFDGNGANDIAVVTADEKGEVDLVVYLNKGK
jgi:VCBS repeat protein